jgi:hypothetical protein
MSSHSYDSGLATLSASEAHYHLKRHEAPRSQRDGLNPESGVLTGDVQLHDIQCSKAVRYHHHSWWDVSQEETRRRPMTATVDATPAGSLSKSAGPTSRMAVELSTETMLETHKVRGEAVAYSLACRVTARDCIGRVGYWQWSRTGRPSIQTFSSTTRFRTLGLTRQHQGTGTKRHSETKRRSSVDWPGHVGCMWLSCDSDDRCVTPQATPLPDRTRPRDILEGPRQGRNVRIKRTSAYFVHGARVNDKSAWPCLHKLSKVSSE